MPKASKTADAFAGAVEQALERIADPAWLGERSPLAAPYFLGAALDAGDALTAVGRGQALRRLLQSAAATLNPETREILDASFFKRKPTLNNAGIALSLNKSEATYYRNRVAAIDALARQVNTQAAPPLRPESPSRVEMIGRAATTAQALAALALGESVSLTGAGGLGKTTLASAVAAGWPGGLRRVFWHTIRPGLNDQAASLIFSLGYFLRGLDAPNTWRQLVADGGATPAARALGLLRHDLSLLAAQPPLLCIDEADLLRDETIVHAQALRLMEELQGVAPLLVIGQRPALEARHHLVLTGLGDADIDALLRALGTPPASAEERGRILEVTRGSPALLRLYAALRRAGDAPATLLTQLAKAPSIELLLGRIWQRLDPDDRQFLGELATFRGAAPADAWADANTRGERLGPLELIRDDGRGGIYAPEYALAFIRQRAPAEARPALHLFAAEARETRGEITEAAYHLLQARQPAAAVWLWLDHFRQERALGRGPAAAALFAEVSDADLPDEDDRRALALIRAELSMLTGDGEAVEGEIGAAKWPRTHPLTPRARQLMGDALAMQGRLDQAVQAYREGIAGLAGQPAAREVDLRVRMGHLALNRMRDPQAAREQAILAQIKALEFLGEVDEDALRFLEARERYASALALAETVAFGAVARWHAHGSLGRVCWKLGDLDASAAHLNEAIALARAAGDVSAPLYHLINLTACHIQAGRYDDALAAARDGLGLAESLRHAYLIAGLSSNAGEACCKLGRWDEAERYAMMALRQEEAAMQPYAAMVLGMVERGRGRPERAASAFRSALQAAQDSQDAFAEAAARKELESLGQLVNPKG